MAVATLAPVKPSFAPVLRILNAQHAKTGHGFQLRLRGNHIVLQILDPKGVMPVRLAQQIACDAGRALKPFYHLASADPLPAWGYRDTFVEFCYQVDACATREGDDDA